MQWLRVMPIFAVLTVNPARQQEQYWLSQKRHRAMTRLVEQAKKNDANDVLYWFESSWDYNPTAGLG